MTHQDSLYAIFENSNDWSVYRDHEKRRYAFNAGWDRALREAADLAALWVDNNLNNGEMEDSEFFSLRAFIIAGEVKE